MVLGLPISAWALLFLAVGLGLGIELAFYLRHRVPRSTTRRPPPEAS